MLSKRVGNRICGLVCAGTLLVGLGNAPASAQTLDERTFFTFSGPVELPGIALAPGTYMFRLIAPNNDHSFVQVVSADGKEIYGVFFTLPVERAPLQSQAEVRFAESAAGAPPAIQAWWYPYDSTGFEFIYPRGQAGRGTTVGSASARATHPQAATTVADPANDAEPAHDN
jgi:hypothetical protein